MLRVLVGSFNIHGERLSTSLGDWLHHETSQQPDIVVLGFQEFTPLRQALVYTNWKKLDWVTRQVLQYWNSVYDSSSEGLRCIFSEQYAGRALLVFLRDSIPVKSVEWSYANVGIGQILGNKGALAVWIQILHDGMPVQFCFVNAHLAPHEHNVDRRNADYHEIIRRLINDRVHTEPDFGDNEAEEPLLLSSSSMTASKPSSQTVLDAHYTFFLGDLNYRINLNPANTAPISMTTLLSYTRDSIHELHPYDQLQRERSESRAFYDFSEAPLNFPPTYKFAIGPKASQHTSYVTSARVPSWCDRILWRYMGLEPPADFDVLTGQDPSKPLSILQYTSHPGYTLSDHKPVSAFFELRPEQLSSSSAPTVIIDPLWKMKRQIGSVSDKTVGCLWTLFGTVPGVTLVTLAILAIVWLNT